MIFILEAYHSFSEAIKQIAMMIDHPIHTIEIMHHNDVYDFSPYGTDDSSDGVITEVQTKMSDEVEVRICFSTDFTDQQIEKWKKTMLQQWEFIGVLKKAQYQLKSKNLLLHTAKSLASSLRLEDVLKQILNNTLEVIDAADAGSIYLYQEEEKVLFPMVTVGFDWKYIKQIRFHPNESLTGVVFQGKHPLIFQETRDVYQGMATMSKENRRLFDLAVPQVSGGMEATSKSAMASPFVIEGKCMGVITINNFFSKGTFDMDDLQLLGAICNQASFAIERAGLFQAIEEQLEEVRSLNESIHTQNVLLEEAHRIHNKLSEMILEKKDVNDMVIEIEDLLGNPVVLYDEHFNCLASTSDETGFELEMPVFLNEFKVVEETHQQMTILPNEEYPIPNAALLHPIIVSNDIKGYLVIIEVNKELTNMNQIAIEQSSTVLAIKLLNVEAIYEAEQRMKVEFLDDIETDIAIELIEKQGKYLGISEKFNYNFIAIEVDSPLEDDLVQFKRDIKRIQKQVEGIVLQMNHSNITFNRMYGLKALVGWHEQIDDETSIKRVIEFIGQINEMIRTRFRGYTCSYAVGRLATKWGELKLSYQDIRKCMDVLRRKGLPNQMMTYKEVGISNLILNNSEEELKYFVQEQLALLINYDQPSREDLLETLYMFFYNNENLSRTASQMHLHVNTLHYRLKRIEDILCISLKDRKLELKLAWNIMELLDKRQEWLYLDR